MDGWLGFGWAIQVETAGTCGRGGLLLAPALVDLGSQPAVLDPEGLRLGHSYSVAYSVANSLAAHTHNYI